MPASAWKAADWAGPGADQHLLKWLEQELNQAITHDDNFSFKGLPFDKTGALAHWGHRPNFFNAAIRTKQQMEQIIREEKRDGKPITLFYFDKLHMDDDDEKWTIQLGDHVLINDPKKIENEEYVDDHYVARVTEIFVTVGGQRRIAVQWMYRMQDTGLAEAIKTDSGYKPKRSDKHDHLKVLPVSGDEWPASRLALCGSSEDNSRYATEYDVECIIDPVKVYFVPPGISSPEKVKALHPDFEAGTDFFYNMYTKEDFYTFEDILFDITPWSHLYRQVWQQKGVKGIERLRGKLALADPDGGFQRLMSLSRGAPDLGRELEVDLGVPSTRQDTPRVLHKLELFAGGGGLSYMGQKDNEHGSIVSSWANDFNASACATYACNKPYTFVSCCGLEELLQLLKKWHAAVNKWLGVNWQTLPEVQPLLALPPGKRYSRKHMPEGVGCGGGEHPEDALPFIHSARVGQKAREDMQKMLLHCAELPNVQEVKRWLVRMQEARDTKPITADAAAWVYKQAKHAKQFKALHDAKEAALAVPDFEACFDALPEVQLLPDAFSDSRSVEEQAARLLEAVLPRQPSEEHFAAADAQQDAQQDDAKKQQGKGKQAGAAGAGAGAVDYKQAVMDAYEGAWRQQLVALVKNLHRCKERDLGEVEEVRDVRVRDCAVRVKQGSSAKQTESALTSYECWLEFEVRRKGSDEWVWEHEALMQLDEAIPAVQKFMLLMTADKTIPLPGDVDIMTGGPPCQNMSGLNRQARQEDVMNDAKNRLVACYLGTVDHLQPGYLLIEQVTDIYKKEDAKYARFTLMTMLLHGYQGRAAILTAGNYGAPQGRLRAIFWGARSGAEQLPPFPAATHQCKAHGINAPKGAEFSIVDALKEGSQVGDVTVPALYPFHVWGDVVGDLPKVDNFAESEREQYNSQPETFLQLWLRRDPPAHELPLLLRAAHADAAMKVWGPLHDPDEVQQALAGNSPDAILAAGLLTMCQTCRWLVGLSRQQARKLAVAHGKEAARAAKAAKAAAGEDDGDDAPDLQIETEDEVSGDEAEDEMMAENEEDVADAAELKKLMGKEKEFTQNVQLKHLQQYSAGDADMAEDLLMMAQTNLHAITQFTGVRSLREMQKAHKSECLLAPLRDQRPHQCNMDDLLRMEELPLGRGVCFRDMAGVVTNHDGTCCAGAWHAAAAPADQKAKDLLAIRVDQYNKLPKAEQEKTDAMKYVYQGVQTKSGCRGGGNDPKPPRGLLAATNNDKQYRVDNYGTSVKGTVKDGCASQTYFLATNGVLCPRWCITYNQGKSIGRNGCFGRIHPDLVQPTVVTRPEPHNLQLVHHQEGRVLTVRENARCQAFPDYHVFVGLDAGNKSGSGKGGRVVSERYLQIGNAVAPAMAFALGRCLLLAAVKKAPVADPVIYSADPEWEAAVETGKNAGCVAYAVAHNVSREAPDNWERHRDILNEGKGKRKAAAVAGEQDAGTAVDADEADQLAEPAAKRKKSSSGSKNKAAAAAAAGGEEQDVIVPPDSNDAAEPAEPAPKHHKSSGKSSKLKAAAAAAGSSKPRNKAPKKQHPSAAAAAAVGDQQAASDQAAPAAAATAEAGSSEVEAADTVIGSDQAGYKSPAVAAQGAAAAAKQKRPKRAKAAAAAAAIHDCLQQEVAPPF